MQREELERLASLPELNPNPVLELDLQGRILYCNPAARRVFPGLRAGVEAHPVLWDAARAASDAREVVLGDRLFEQRVSHEHDHLRIYMVDVTTRRRAEEELHAARGHLEQIVDAKTAESDRLANVVRQSSESIVITDLDGVIEYVNPAFERVTGYRAAEAVGRNPRILKAGHAAYPPGFYEELWRTIRAGGVWRGEFTNRKKNGETYTEEAVIFPMKDPQTGAITGYGAVKADVTLRKELEERVKTSLEEMRGLKEQAEEASRSKSEFLAHMSHEIRTPLNGIIGFMDLLARSPLDQRQGEFVETIRRSAGNMLSIINGILDLSKIESGKLELERVPFDPRAELESVVDMFRSAAAAAGVRFYSFIDPNLPARLIGDALRLKQVLTNLISNSLKFTPGGRSVSVDVRRLGAGARRCRIRFSVADEGIGIPADRQRLILEAFTQADTSVARRFGGTGLGLAISTNLVSRMGGQLELESEEGKGSTFRFVLDLPIESSAPPRSLPTVGVALVTGRSSRLEELLEDYLVALRCRVLKAESAERIPSGADLVVLASAGEVQEAVASYSRCGLPVLLVTEAGESAVPTPPAVRVIEAPVHGSKLYDAVAEIAFGETARRIVARAAAPSEARARGRALVAEDNPVNQKLVGYMLREAGLEVDVAGDGAEAVRLFDGGRYDVVFMDASMPVLDGIEATRMILELEGRTGRPHTPIVALTAHAIKGDRERFLQAGMDDYLSKPIDTDALARVLRQLLGWED